MSTAKAIHARYQISYPSFKLDVDLHLPGTGVCAIFGPSGSGKTSLLRAIAGLERGEQAYLEINDQCWDDSTRGQHMPTHKRALGYVFQDAALFAHLSVIDNIRYGFQRSSAARQNSAVIDSLIALLELEALLTRMPAKLSGGERQRVAIARALATSPELLLMDEPLAALDHDRRAEILPYLQRLHRQLDIPVLYVTHAMDELSQLADHIVLLKAGAVLANGPVAETLTRLDLAFSARSDASVIIEGCITQHDAHYALNEITFDGGTLSVPSHSASQHSPRNNTIGSEIRLQILARDVSIARQRHTDSSIQNAIAVTIREKTEGNNVAQLTLRLQAGNTSLLASITRRAWDSLQLEIGQSVWAQIKAVAVMN